SAEILRTSRAISQVRSAAKLESTMNLLRDKCGLQDMRKAAIAPVVILAILGMALATGCAKSSEDNGQGEVARVSRLDLLLGEYYFEVESRAKGAPLELQAGRKYTLRFINMGSELHEVLIGRDVVTEDGQPTSYRRNMLDGVRTAVEGSTAVGDRVGDFEVVAGAIEELELEPGVVLEVKFTIPKDKVGEWELACFIPGHY
ncbi:MAG: hypothetical protein O2783_08355, partial [Chloroflexi bacterium]|nr:hypothetical protein [Chloroflexota bacterium]